MRDGFRSGGFVPVKEGDELEVKIEAVGAKGDGIAKKDGFVLFVPNTQEGQTVKVKVNRVLRRVGFADVVGEGAPAEEKQEDAVEEVQEEATKEEPSEDTEDFGDEPAAEGEKKEDAAEEVQEEAAEETEEPAEEEKQEESEEVKEEASEEEPVKEEKAAEDTEDFGDEEEKKK